MARARARRQRSHGSGSLFKRTGGGPWIARWFTHDGKRREQSTRTTDKATAERILSKHVSDAALRRDGVIDAARDRFSVEGRRPFRDHVRDYLSHCRHVGYSEKHVVEKVRHLDRLADSGIEKLSDLTPETLERHLRAVRESGLSARTVNFSRQTAVAFMGWCVKSGRVESNSLRLVAKLDESRDRRRVRRPLTDDALARLLAVADQHGRRAWYLTAALAGLRRGDLERLKWADIDLGEGSLTVCEGKAKRSDVVPVHPQLAQELRRPHAEQHPFPTARVFPRTVTALTVLKDLLRAGLARREPVLDANGKPIMAGRGRKKHPKTRIVTTDDEGRVIDLHAMRTTLGTNLARAGVAPQLAQRIMRHADYRTTLKHYTVLGLTDTASAIGRLPDVAADERQAARATGTNNATPDGADNATPDPRHFPRQLGGENVPTVATGCQGSAAGATSCHTRKTRQNTGKNGGLRGVANGCREAGDATRTRNIQLGRLMLYH